MAKKILVAEDERPLATALQLKLTSVGYEVNVASDGVETMEALAKEKFDLLLLDLIMPKMDGFTVLEKIGKSMSDMHIIVLSNLGQDEDRKRVAIYGITDYFIKSDTPLADIIKRINTLLAHGTAE